MLSIILSKCDEPNYISDPNMYFDNTYEEDWITSEIGRKIIKEIDKTEVRDDGTLKSPVLGGIVPRELSGGAKTLMLIYFDSEKIFNASVGENCDPILLEIGAEKDRTVRLGYPMFIEDKDIKGQPIQIVNDGTYIHNTRELIMAENRYL